MMYGGSGAVQPRFSVVESVRTGEEQEIPRSMKTRGNKKYHGGHGEHREEEERNRRGVKNG